MANHITTAAIAGLALALTLAGCKSAPPAPDDAGLTSAIQSRIAADAAISAEPIQTSVQGGVATLNGTVSSPAARSLAASDAAQVAGIKTVVNNLSIQTAPLSASVVAPSPAPVATLPVRKPSALIRPEPRQGAPIERAQNRAQNQEQNPPPPLYKAPQQPAQQTPSAPPPPPQPVVKNITLPAGSTLPVRITQTLDSATTQPGSSFSGSIATDVIVDGVVVLPQGSGVSGRVDTVQDAAHFKGSSLLTIELTNVRHHGEQISVATEPFTKEGTGRGKNTAEKVGGGAAVGAILGGIFGGGKGAAVGAAAGGGLGAGAQAVTRGQQVQIPSESLVRFRLTSPITVRTVTNPDGSTNRDNPDATLQRRNNQQ